MSAVPLTDRGRRTRDALILAARDVFEERGYAATRMSDIAVAAGVSHGTVYTWFATKESVLAAVVESLASDISESLRVPEGTDPVKRIDVANRSYLDTYLAHSKLLSVIEQAAAVDDSFRDILSGLRQAHVQRVAVAITHLQKTGVTPTDLDPQLTAAALCAMVEGFARHWMRGDMDEERAAAALTRIWAGALDLASKAGSS